MRFNRFFITILTLLILLSLKPRTVKGADYFTKNLGLGMARKLEVKKVQEFLSDEGLYLGPITGNYFSLTLRAVKRFQKREKIKPDTGRWDKKTRGVANGIILSREEEKEDEESVNVPVRGPLVEGTTTPPVISTTTPKNGIVEPNAPQTAPYIPPAPAQSPTPSTTTATRIAPQTTGGPITVRSPNGGETWQYNLNYGISYTSSGIASIGYKIFKSGRVVYTGGPLNAGDSIYFPTNAQNTALIGYGSDYKVRVFNWDNPDIYDESDNYFSVALSDTKPPAVSLVAASSISTSSAVITWTTDEPATGYVNYGSDKVNYSDWKVTPQDDSLTTSIKTHSFTLTGLKSGALYYYRVYAMHKFRYI